MSMLGISWCSIKHYIRPYFYLWFNMGVKGAALATVISQGVSALWT